VQSLVVGGVQKPKQKPISIVIPNQKSIKISAEPKSVQDVSGPT